MKEGREKLDWPDDEAWRSLFEHAFTENPERAQTAAEVWYLLLQLLADEAEGVGQVRSILKKALRFTYPYTPSYRLAYKHFKLSLSGQVHPDDEPIQLLKASIERARASISAARRSSAE